MNLLYLIIVTRLAIDISTVVTNFSNSKPQAASQPNGKNCQIVVNPASTLGPSSTMMIELSNICVVFVFECGQPGLQSSTLPLSVHPGRGRRPWIKLSKSINLFFWDPISTEYAKQNTYQLSGKSTRLAFTGAIEKAETLRQ